MALLQKILFPFSGPKTKFLEGKWWHRLAKVVFVISFGVVLFFCTLYVIDDLQYKVFQQQSIEEPAIIQQPQFDIKQVIGELGATILSNPRANVEETKAKFPEFANVDTQVFGELGATIIANPNITIEEVMQKFPELSSGEQGDTQVVSEKPQNIIIILCIILPLLLYIYLGSVFLQFVYFRGIVYIIYGSNVK